MNKLPLLCATALLPILPATAEITLSERLTKIAGNLGDGGVHFSVTDSKGDLQKVATVLDEVLKVIPEADLPPGLKVDSLFDDLGLYSIEGSGTSSHKVGWLWHNRNFILTDGNHRGVLSLLGDKPRATIAHDFAPAGADLVLETTINLREVQRTSAKISKALGDDAERELSDVFQQEATSLGLSLADIFADFTVHGTLVFWLDEEKTFEAGPGLVAPVPHFAARLDQAGMVFWKLLKSELGPQSDLTESGDEILLAPKGSEEETPFGTVKPQFVWNSSTEQLFFSLTSADLAVCRGDGPRLTDDAEFKIASMGFPAETSGMAYVSKDFLTTALTLSEPFAGEAPPEAQAIITKVLPYLKDLVDHGGYAGAFAVKEDGFLFISNSPLASKGSSGMGLGGVGTVATLAGIATPLISKAQNNAEVTRDLSDLKMLAAIQLDHFSETGKWAKSLDELIAAEFLAPDFANLLDGNGVVFLESPTKLPNGGEAFAFMMSRSTEDEVLVALTDGAVIKMETADFKTVLGTE